MQLGLESYSIVHNGERIAGIFDHLSIGGYYYHDSHLCNDRLINKAYKKTLG